MDVATASLEAMMQRVTNPENKQPDVPAIEAFCVLTIQEPNGVQIGSKLLASHIQSSNEKEALQALTLLDACMNKCGAPFRSEIGKFRFLNEMIKLVSPKYLGDKTPNSVRQKVLQLLSRWIEDYPRETKIKEAHQLLTKQGVVKDDVAPTKKRAVFEDEEKSKLLQKLLRSKNPDDLQAANRLIKTMVKEDERRSQQNSQRTMELESVHNNVKLLSEMLDSYDAKETGREDLELMRELHQACERLKPVVLKLANDIQDDERMLGEVLTASDELTQIFDKYKNVIVLGEGTSLLDLSSSLDVEDEDRDLMPSDMEVLGDIFNSIDQPTNPSLLPDSTILRPVNVPSNSRTKESVEKKSSEKNSKTKALDELNELGESLLKESLSWIKTSASKNPTLTELDLNGDDDCPKIKPLTDVDVDLRDVKPGTHPPKTVIDEKNGITVVLHFAKEGPREDVSVIVVTTVNKNEKPLSDYLFQAVVSKNCKCRLQSPSGTELPAHNPFLPPSAITQIMLIANPNQEPVSLKFMLSYTMDDETYTEMGEVDRVPR